MTNFSRSYTHIPSLGEFTLTGDEKGGLVITEVADDGPDADPDEERVFQVSETVGGWRICGYFASEEIANKVRDELLALTDWTVGPEALKKVDGLEKKIHAISDSNGGGFFRTGPSQGGTMKDRSTAAVESDLPIIDDAEPTGPLMMTKMDAAAEMAKKKTDSHA